MFGQTCLRFGLTNSKRKIQGFEAPYPNSTEHLPSSIPTQSYQIQNILAKTISWQCLQRKRKIRHYKQSIQNLGSNKKTLAQPHVKHPTKKAEKFQPKRPNETHVVCFRPVALLRSAAWKMRSKSLGDKDGSRANITRHSSSCDGKKKAQRRETRLLCSRVVWTKQK